MKLTLWNEKNKEFETTNLDKEHFLGPETSDVSEEEMDILNMLLYLKDRFNISGSAYHKMAQLCKGNAKTLQAERSHLRTQQDLEYQACTR